MKHSELQLKKGDRALHGSFLSKSRLSILTDHSSKVSGCVPAATMFQHLCKVRVVCRRVPTNFHLLRFTKHSWCFKIVSVQFEWCVHVKIHIHVRKNSVLYKDYFLWRLLKKFANISLAM